jgi:hypothetical protein
MHTDTADNNAVPLLLAAEWTNNVGHYRDLAEDSYVEFDAALRQWLEVQHAMIKFKEYKRPNRVPAEKEAVHRYMAWNELRLHHGRWTGSVFQINDGTADGALMLSALFVRITMSNDGDLAIFEEGLRAMDRSIEKLIDGGSMGWTVNGSA